MNNILIIGTSHIAKQSIDEIKKTVAQWKPDIVAVELDVQRATSLLKNEKNKISINSAFQVGFQGYLFAKIGQFVQQKLGKIVRISPGADMKSAMEEAAKEKLQIALIDQPVQITLKKFSNALTWREKLRFGGDLIKGVFNPKKQIKELGLETLDLRKVPEQDLIKKMMKPLKERYPSIYKVLVEDRNKYMVKRIVKLMRDNKDKKILVVVGAGHKEGMEELLKRVEIV